MGGRERQGYAGRGPKNYQRSDERVLEDACQTLERHPEIDASEIEVSCERGEIVLRPTAVTGGGTQLTVTVPINAVSGAVRVVGTATPVPRRMRCVRSAASAIVAWPAMKLWSSKE